MIDHATTQGREGKLRLKEPHGWFAAGSGVTFQAQRLTSFQFKWQRPRLPETGETN